MKKLTKSESWYRKRIEKPLRGLVRLLRDNGFNTTCSCGHLPRPYISMEWYSDDEVTRLYKLLVENKYSRFTIKAFWNNTFEFKNTKMPRRSLEVIFCKKMPLAEIKDIREEL